MWKIASFFAFAAFLHVPVRAENRVNVTVYYESLCSDSIKFFTQQLYPVLNGNLSTYINLQLVPFGKSTQNEIDGEYHFVCNHGAKECLGNKLQACSLKLIDKGANTPGYGFNQITVRFINCLMSEVKHDGDRTVFPTATCAQNNTGLNLAMIENCAIHSDGSEYLAELGRTTIKFQQPLLSVPTIVFNSKYQMTDSELSRSNFVKALCQYINDKPAECLANTATNLQLSFSLIIAISSLFFYYF